ncbi:heme ABC transporter permease [Moraxella catarrhalis]|uniref:heme ABC transporter permease n=2 Tax=Moraxella catarrhalis TaxID=480 RepID=UPI0007E32ED8|nr:heme ABC transporter permease [Moraxella catarrhalis]OAV15045.1 Cytochrome c-type biogenesis protein CcmC, putative heme lyase for CcmE [Moraxella catarrhalis]OAV17348.1 Cytochrome c-type biogenesis protein CcmC, putative heme lyase for CcmE [Moraxella catarrhalis]OBX43531.1 heme ABC transporter permease [Moraxella catarrhalis]
MPKNNPAPNTVPKNGGFIDRLWQGFLTTVGTERFFYIFSPWVKYLATIAALLLGTGLVWALGFAPPDYLQGNSYRIIFIHVPTASLAMSIYFALSVLGVIFLVWKIKTANIVAQAIAPIGFIFCVISLLTGSIWAKPTWGTYWVWDARLTSMLILAFLYAGVIALFSAFESSSNRGKAAAILSIVGAVNLPIIKYSVEWWNTLHQGATFTVTNAPKMSASMWAPLLIMILGMYFMVAAIAIYRTNSLILAREANKAWVMRLINQSQEGV